MKIGGANVASFRLGSITPSRVYLGSVEVWSDVAAGLTALGSGYTGEGTQASPYTGGSQGNALFQAAANGTIYYTLTTNAQGGDSGSELFLRLDGNTIRYEYIYYTTNWSGSFSIANGSTIGFYGDALDGPNFTVYFVPS